MEDEVGISAANLFDSMPYIPTLFHGMATRVRIVLRLGVASMVLCLAGCAREPAARTDEPRVRPHATVRVAPSAGCSDEESKRSAREVLRGFASYYHDSLEGNATASGPAYDPDLYTAAHRKLPFGTRLRVSRTDVERPPVCVTVNDRGPFGSRRRIVDLSRRAAEDLQMVGEGIVPVRVDVL